MKRFSRPILGAILVLACWAARADKAPDGRLDIDLVEADSAIVFRSLAKALEASETRIEECGQLTMRLDGVTPRTALQAACESLGCSWSFEGGALEILCDGEAPEASGSLDETISIQLVDARLDQVMRAMASVLESDLDLGDLGERPVTVQIEDLPAREALDQVCAQAGCFWRYETETGRLVVGRPGYGLEFDVGPASEEGVYRCRARVSDLVSGEVVSAPTIVFREGEEAEVQSGLPGGGVVTLRVEVAEDGGEVRLEATVVESGELVAAQSARYSLR